MSSVQTGIKRTSTNNHQSIQSKDPRNVQSPQLTQWTPLALIQVYIWLCVLPKLCKPHWETFWTQLTPLQGDLVINSFGMIFFPLYCLAMLPVYIMDIPFFEQFKISDKPWPWRKDQPTKVQNDFWKLSKRSIKLYSFNNLILVPFLTILNYQMVKLVGEDILPQASHIDDDWPTTMEMIYQNILFTITHEFFFYTTHRMMHKPQFYSWHKVHHEYKQNTVLASQHNHPVDYFFSIAGPALFAITIVRPKHSIIKLQSAMWALFANYDDHCGYSFPWSPVRWFPLASLTDHHEFHHSHNIGCFESKLSVFDKLFGGEERYLIWKAKRPLREEYKVL